MIHEVQHLEGEERTNIHEVLFFEVGVELIDQSIREDAESSIRDGEIPHQLRELGLSKGATDLLALDENAGTSIVHERVVHLLALLRADVRSELGNHIIELERVVPQHLYEWQDEGVFRSLLGFDVVIRHPSGKPLGSYLDVFCKFHFRFSLYPSIPVTEFSGLVRHAPLELLNGLREG